MYSQGMAPVFRMVPGKANWERIRDKPTYTVSKIKYKICLDIFLFVENFNLWS